MCAGFGNEERRKILTFDILRVQRSQYMTENTVQRWGKCVIPTEMKRNNTQTCLPSLASHLNEANTHSRGAFSSAR